MKIHVTVSDIPDVPGLKDFVEHLTEYDPASLHDVCDFVNENIDVRIAYLAHLVMDEGWAVTEALEQTGKVSFTIMEGFEFDGVCYKVS